VLPDLNQRLGGNAESFVQSSNHVERELAPAIQHLVHTIPAADKGNKVARLQPILLHVVSNGFYRVRQIERIVVPLPCLHQCDQYIKPIALGRIPPGIHQSFDLPESAAIIAMGFDRCDIHG